MRNPSQSIPPFQPGITQPVGAEFQPNFEVKALRVDIRSPKLPRWQNPNRVTVQSRSVPTWATPAHPAIVGEWFW